MRLTAFIAAMAAAFAAAAPALAETPCLPPVCTEFPADAGALNVRDFGARGDGVTDDTAAINAALTASGGDTGPAFWHDRIVYFPRGAYLVSSPVMKRYEEGRYGSGSILIGQERDTTVIRLKDRAPGYGDPAHPKAIVFTSAKLLDGDATSGGKDYTNKGEGNDAFMNFVENMTIDAGAGNPGAIGIDYLANNLGAIRNVAVRAGEGSGAAGIALTRKWPGPALIQNVAVRGFDIGIDAAHTEYGVTMDHIRLEKPRRIGLRNNRNALSIHDLTVEDAPIPVANVAPDGLIVIDGGMISGSAPGGGDAIRNAGFMNLRAVAVSGYESALGGPADAPLDGVYRAGDRLADSRQPWSLAAEDAPLPSADPVAEWKSVTEFGARPDSGEDATAAIRRAFASGAGTIYFPHGTYLISDNIIVPPSVRRIAGMTSTIQPHPERPDGFRRDAGMFIAANNAHPLIIERIALDNSWRGEQAGVEAAGTQPVLIRDVAGAGVTTLMRRERGGKAFLENTCCGPVDIAGGQGVWARQLDTEGPGVRIRNRGAPLWLLGVKTEAQCTVLENSGGARAEVLGGLIYIVGSAAADPAIPAFRNIDSRMLLSYAEESFHPQSTYTVHLADTRKGETREVTADALPMRAVGRMAPQILGGAQDNAQGQ